MLLKLLNLLKKLFRRRVYKKKVYPYSISELKSRANVTLTQLFEIDENILLERAAVAMDQSNNNVVHKTAYKLRKTFDVRKQEVDGIKLKFPNKVPIIVERYYKEQALPALDKVKFLVPQELTMSQFSSIIRNRMLISNTQSIYLITNNRSVTSLSKTVLEVYQENCDSDGFLYVTYASQAMFGLKM